jgi:hypothetical protein
LEESLASSLARSSGQKAIPAREAKAKVIDLFAEGYKVADAMRVVGRAEATYWDWRKTDPEFKRKVDLVRAARGEEKQNGRPEVPDFETFCREWMKQPLNIHQLRILDVIEGREPRDMHPSMDFYQGYDNRVVINVPPEHGKSTTFTVNYVVWRIHKDPDVRVVIVSKGSQLSADFLYEIKLKLTSSLYQEMHLRFAPEGGWKDPDGSWSGDRIYVRGKNVDGVQKDPTVQAIGLKGQIYGRRADLVILDDIVDTKNARETDLQLRLINRDISSRLPSLQEGGGLLLALGTRVAPMDIYRILLDARDGDDDRVWTYFRQPAVLDYGTGDSATWETLWPGKWNGKSLARNRVDAGWNLVYQQLDLEDDMTFKAEAVNASVNGQRFPGPMTEAGKGHREEGMNGLYVVGGLDPATVGNTAMVVAGLDRLTLKRWVLDGFNQANCSPHTMRETVKKLTEMYRIHEWVIERNAFQRFLTQDRELLDFLRARGCKLTEHYTTDNKFDSDFGIATMAPLFDSCVVEDKNTPGGWRRVTKGALVELPSMRQNAWVNQMVQQLTTWMPEGQAQKAKTDLVMALWFTHIAFMRKLQRKQGRKTHMDSPFMTPAGRGKQRVIDLAALRRAKQDRELEASA